MAGYMHASVDRCLSARTTNCDDRRLGKARERLLEATGDYAFPPGGQLDEITGLRKQTRVRDLQFKVNMTAGRLLASRLNTAVV